MVNLGIAYENKKEYEKAIECYKKTVEIDPEDKYGWENLSIAYKAIKNFVNAEKARKLIKN